MTSLTKTVRVVQNNMLPYVALKHRKLFEFGIKAFSLTSFTSLAGNARKTVSNRNTAHSKLYRLVSNQHVIHNFSHILHHLQLVKKHSLVNVDFSSFCGFEMLGFGVQTGKGRALPIWADCITYPIKNEASQNIFIINTMKKLAQTIDFWPRFVFDRGFMIPSLVAFMLKENIVFYVRIKAGKHVQYREEDKKGIPACRILPDDAVIYAYGARLRLVRSEKPDADTDPWYILTNDFKALRNKIINIYYCRFEIEEVFKDIKHLFTIQKLWIKKQQTFMILLWFVIVSFWIAWLTGIAGTYLEYKSRLHTKKHLSWIKLWFEDITREAMNIAYQRVGLTGG